MADAETAAVMSYDNSLWPKRRPREPRGYLKGSIVFSRTPNNYNNLGNLLFVRQSTQEAPQMPFGHSFVSCEKNHDAT